jgi:hypothetical protein
MMISFFSLIVQVVDLDPINRMKKSDRTHYCLLMLAMIGEALRCIVH